MTFIEYEQQTPVRHPAQRSGGKVDGRNMRRDRNKDAVIDAYLDLISEGAARPSVAEVADRSGVSHRSVFRYFSDTDELARASIERQVERVTHLLDTGVDLTMSVGERIEVVLQRRLTLFEAIAPISRLVRLLAREQAVMRQELTNNRLLYREQLRRMFGPELSAMPADQAANTLAVVDVLCSFDANELFREDQGLSRDEAAAALRHALVTLFG
jgi:AcrR family transcriptional regulator